MCNWHHILLQVKADLKKVIRKMFPESQLSAHSQLTSYKNKEGIFGDDVLMGLTEEGNPHQVPTYQFWDQEGKSVCRCPTGLVRSSQYAH